MLETLLLLLALMDPAPDPVGLLREADEARGNLEGVSWRVQIDSHEAGKESSLALDVKARGYDFRGEGLEPPKFKGQTLLMLEGSMWFHKPGLSKPVPISRRQRLMGRASYGDVAATNYAGEYAGEIVGEEEIDGEPCYVFDLRAEDKKATYDRIAYWVSKERHVGMKAVYYTVSGKVIKSAAMDYGHTIEDGGTSRPFISRIVIADALGGGDVTTFTFGEPGFEELPDYLFNLSLLGR